MLTLILCLLFILLISLCKNFMSFGCRGKFKVPANKYQGMKAIYEVKMSRKFRKKIALNGYLDLRGGSLITRKIELHPD